MIRRCLALVAAVLTAGLVWGISLPPAASAGTTSTALTNQLLATRLPALGEVVTPVLRLAPMNLKKGQKRYFYGRVAVRSNAPRGPMIGSRIICLAVGGGGGSTYTTRNHDGQRFGIRSTVTRWLFTAPHDGSYRCELRAWAATLLSPAKVHLTLVPDKTLLRSSNAKPAAVEWRDQSDRCVGLRRIPTLLQCNKAISGRHVLRRGVNLGSARSANIVGDVELTREYGPYPGGVSKVRTTLYATQLTSRRKACVPTRKVAATSTINNDIHHLKVNMTLSGLKPSTRLLCTDRFRIGVAVRLLQGNPVTIHNTLYSNLIVLPTAA